MLTGVGKFFFEPRFVSRFFSKRLTTNKYVFHFIVIDDSLKEPLNLVQEEPTHDNAVVSATPASRGPSQKGVLLIYSQTACSWLIFRIGVVLIRTVVGGD